MRLINSLLVLLVAMLNVPPTYAQASCSEELNWTDSTYAQRTTARKGQIVRADVEAFANASVIHLSVNDAQSGMIEILSKNRADSIQLTFGHGKPNPVEFSEISMVVEPPMSNGAWPRMMSPCAISDGASIDFDGDDISAFVKEHVQAFPKFHGTIRRRGLRISYSMDVEDGESWKGEVDYERELKYFDLHTDVQGWHVFRANSYVETLPIGKPVSVLSVIEKMALNETSKVN